MTKLILGLLLALAAVVLWPTSPEPSEAETARLLALSKLWHARTQALAAHSARSDSVIATLQRTQEHALASAQTDRAHADTLHAQLDSLKTAADSNIVLLAENRDLRRSNDSLWQAQREAARSLTLMTIDRDAWKASAVAQDSLNLDLATALHAQGCTIIPGLVKCPSRKTVAVVSAVVAVTGTLLLDRLLTNSHEKTQTLRAGAAALREPVSQWGQHP